MANTIVETRTDDPVSPVAGQMWFRSDLVPGFIPSAPSTGFSVTAGDTQITLIVGTVAAATSYNAYYTSDGSTPTKTNGTKLTGVTDGQVVGSLTNGTSYKIVFTAVGTNGESVESAVITSTPAVGPLFTDTFTAANGTALDTNKWTVYTLNQNSKLNAGSTILDVQSNMARLQLAKVDTATTDMVGKNLLATPTIDFSGGKKYRITWKARIPGQTTGQSFFSGLGLTTDSANFSAYQNTEVTHADMLAFSLQPAPTSICVLGHRRISSSVRQYDGYVTASGIDTVLANALALSGDVLHTFVLEIDTTGWSVSINGTLRATVTVSLAFLSATTRLLVWGCTNNNSGVAQATVYFDDIDVLRIA